MTVLNLELRSLISNHDLESRISSECYHFFSRIKISTIFAVTTVIHKSRNMIGTLGSSEFGPEYGQVFQRNVMSPC